MTARFKLLVTGGSGYLGTAVLRRAPQDWQKAATYFANPILEADAAAFRVDVRDAGVISAVVQSVGPDAIIHTAAQMVGADLNTVNADGSRNVARAATRVHARLIHLSTDVIFDGEHAPYDDRAAPAPITPYGASKALAEASVLAECPEAIVARTSLIYGFAPVDPRTRQVLNGEMPNLFTDEFRCPIFVDDLADALLELVVGDYAGVLNVAGPTRTSRYEFGVKLSDWYGVQRKFRPALSDSHSTPRPRDCTLDTRLATQFLRTPLRTFEQAASDFFGRGPARG